MTAQRFHPLSSVAYKLLVRLAGASEGLVLSLQRRDQDPIRELSSRGYAEHLGSLSSGERWQIMPSGAEYLDALKVKVGDRFTARRYQQTGVWGQDWIAEFEVTVTRVTPTRAYVNKGTWFSVEDPRRRLFPNYIDYQTYAEVPV